jgi:amidophosphoribosyltransferase
VQRARAAGARKVDRASAAPPGRHPKVDGIDMPTREELVAHGRSVEQVREFIGADALIYQDVEAMKRVVAALNPRLDGFEASCFDGRYITGDVSAEEFSQLEAGGRARAGEDEDPASGRLALHAAAEGQR